MAFIRWRVTPSLFAASALVIRWAMRITITGRNYFSILILKLLPDGVRLFFVDWAACSVEKVAARDVEASERLTEPG
jgi:hypothetical protein